MPHNHWLRVSSVCSRLLADQATGTTYEHIPDEEQEVGVAQEVLNEVQMGVDHLEVLPGVEGQEESHDMVLVLHEWDSQGVDGYHNQQLH